MAEPSPRPLVDEAAVKRLMRWLPLALVGHLIVGVPTLLISLVVAYGTFVQARATQKMQEAATWPFVAFDTSNYTDDGERRINLTLTNNGVGPALLGPIELRYQGRPMHNPRELLIACCGVGKGDGVVIRTTPPSGVALRPGEEIAFFEMRDEAINQRFLDRLEAERLKFDVRSCYCSIFDNCWIIHGVQSKPQPVDQCPGDWTLYRDR